MTELEQRATHALESIGVVKPRRSPITPMLIVGLLTAAAGAIAAYILDPQMGRTRRAVTRDRMAGEARRLGRWSARRGRWIASTASGIGQRVQHATDEAEVPVDEVALVNRVKSELFRDPGIDKGAIAVNVERDVLFLRGTAPTAEQIEEIGHRASRIEGVGRVVNLLHLPCEPAPGGDRGGDDAGLRWAVPR
jgi:hyperosmotically inducible periplasmic protein